MNKASGGDGIPVELFQILKDDAIKMLHSICQQIWKTQLWAHDWKRSVFIPIPKEGEEQRILACCSPWGRKESDMIQQLNNKKYTVQLRQLRIHLQCKRPGFSPWVGKILWRREQLSTPVFLPGESHGQRSLAGYGPWGQIVRQHFHFHTKYSLLFLQEACVSQMINFGLTHNLF